MRKVISFKQCGNQTSNKTFAIVVLKDGENCLRCDRG